MQLGKIRLDEMHQRHPGLTQPIAASYDEAASVCLNNHHTSPIALALLDDRNEISSELVWNVPAARVLGAWANTTDATEAGAYGCVIAAVEVLRGYYAVRRAETGTGAEYYIGPAGSDNMTLKTASGLKCPGWVGVMLTEVRRRLAGRGRYANARCGSAGQTRLPGSNLPMTSTITLLTLRIRVRLTVRR